MLSTGQSPLRTAGSSSRCGADARGNQRSPSTTLRAICPFSKKKNQCCLSVFAPCSLHTRVFTVFVRKVFTVFTTQSHYELQLSRICTSPSSLACGVWLFWPTGPFLTRSPNLFRALASTGKFFADHSLLLPVL